MEILTAVVLRSIDTDISLKEVYLPKQSVEESILLNLAQSSQSDMEWLEGFVGGPNNLTSRIGEVISHRLELAGKHLRNGDSFLVIKEYRTSISRHYYAMYHSARAICFGYHRGDDYQKHFVLPKHMPDDLEDRWRFSGTLNESRLLRNMADYDLYPLDESKWSKDANRMSSLASEFVSVCEEYAKFKGWLK